MSELPQVGQTYQHKTRGKVTVEGVKKRGRGHYVEYVPVSPAYAEGCGPFYKTERSRLKDWQKSVTNGG